MGKVMEYEMESIKLPKGTVLENGWIVRMGDHWVRVTHHRISDQTLEGNTAYEFVPEPKRGLSSVLYGERSEWEVKRYDNQGAEIKLPKAYFSPNPRAVFDFKTQVREVITEAEAAVSLLNQLRLTDEQDPIADQLELYIRRTMSAELHEILEVSKDD